MVQVFYQFVLMDSSGCTGFLPYSGHPPQINPSQPAASQGHVQVSLDLIQQSAGETC